MATKFVPTHKTVIGDVPVMAVRWVKDGDHPDVERYPIERREYKGLMKYRGTDWALRFGDWILEDEKGKRWLVEPIKFAAEYVEAK
jgi:hypothetical protein